MKYYPVIKVLFELLLILIFSPFILVLVFLISFLILFFDGRPVFYSSKRVGKNLKIFKMYKFRTMKIGSIDIRNDDGTTFNSKNDYRVTKIGSILRKLSFDELPQIINVLKGEMALIGPRPDLEDQTFIYNNLKFGLERFNVRPGITGYAQVKGRNLLDIYARTKYDVFYVENLSFILDLKILFLTIKNVILSKGINKKSDN
jgi:undecaprenyl phosphate N,N'-diacetylbacillosamine 1-phosphate transferase